MHAPRVPFDARSRQISVTSITSIRLRQGYGGQASKSMGKSFRIFTADHTGITVSNLERSLAFWRDVLGFEFSHTAHQSGALAKEITGVPGAEIKLGVVKSPGGHKIELLEYLAPPERQQRGNLRPCDV
ncbi:MAG: VOC family protein, partial [Verrucomicrobia bacterium]|nr:VOC family protein [Verrucomicrobiota bacterium]